MRTRLDAGAVYTGRSYYTHVSPDDVDGGGDIINHFGKAVTSLESSLTRKTVFSSLRSCLPCRPARS